MIPVAKGDNRTVAQIKNHYKVEKELAQRLRDGAKQDRRHLYSALYDELFRRIPDHPQVTRKVSPEAKVQGVSREMAFLRRFLNRTITFLEIGPGDCALSLEVARTVMQVVAVDVSDEVTKDLTLAANFRLILSDGSDIPVTPGSIDLAYSNQLMEHLHPDDAYAQLQNIYAALAPGGAYVCVTPNRLNGPHDISAYFDETATGFHLKEYTTRELVTLFRSVGFSSVRTFVGGKGIFFEAPPWTVSACESLIERLPRRLRRRVAGHFPFKPILGIRIVGMK